MGKAKARKSGHRSKEAGDEHVHVALNTYNLRKRLRSEEQTEKPSRLRAVQGSLRKSATEDKAVPQTPDRSKRRRDAPSTVVKDRIQRAILQRLFLLDHKRTLLAAGVDDESDTSSPSPQQRVDIFVIVGSCGNLYEVVLGTDVKCTCPDFVVHNSCKHVYWVLMRCAGLHQDDPLLWQRTLMVDELDKLLKAVDARLHRPSTARSIPVASTDAQAAFEKLSGVCVSKEISRLSHVRAPWLNEMCAVCMLHMEKDEEPSLSWCGTCGRSLHRDCLELWHKHRRKALQVLPCPWCRSPWVDGSVEAGWIAAHGAPQPEASDSQLSLASSSSGPPNVLPKTDTRASFSEPAVTQNEGFWNLARQQGLSAERATGHGEKRHYNAY